MISVERAAGGDDEDGCRTNLRVLRVVPARAGTRTPRQGSRILVKKTKDYRHPAEYYTDPENSIGYLARVVFRSFSRLLERRTLTHDVSRSEEHTSELQSLMRISYAVFCLKKKKIQEHTEPIH